MNPKTLQSKFESWTWGRSLSVYTHPAEIPGFGVGERSIEGGMVHDFKYTQITTSRRGEIIAYFAKAIQELIRSELGPLFPKETPPFDRCITPPANRPNKVSLPAEIAIELCNLESRYLTHAAESLGKTREGAVMKALPVAERANSISMLYKAIPSKIVYPNHGFLIIDDVFDTGSTLEEVCRALQVEYPDIPRYVITLTHLWRSF